MLRRRNHFLDGPSAARSLILSVLVFGGAVSTSVASEATAPAEYRQRVWTRQHGLPSNAIQAILQTRDGFLWVATRSGLARFDGIRFVVFDRKNTPAFKGDECTALAEDLDRNLWIGTTKGLVRLSKGEFTSFTASDGLWDNYITTLCATTEGDVWIGTVKGPVRFQKGNFTRFPPREGIVSEIDSTTLALYQDRSGTLWIGSNSGLQRWDRESLQFRDALFAHSRSDLSRYAKQLAEDSSGSLWIRGTRLWNKDSKAWNDAGRLRDELSDENITCIFADRRHQPWLATKSQGLVQLRDGQFSLVAPRNVLPDGHVSCMHEDFEGNLWVGTQTGGLVQWLPRRFLTYTTDQGLLHDNVWALFQRRDGTIWIGTDGGLSCYKLESEPQAALPSSGSRPQRAGESVETSPHGQAGRRARPPQPRFQHFTRTNGLIDNAIRALYEDRSGILWIGTGNGLHRLTQDGAIAPHRFSGNEIDNTVRAIAEHRAGLIWIGAQTGLHCLQDGKWTTLTTKDGLPGNDIRALLEDDSANLWAGTAGGGLCRLGNGGATLLLNRSQRMVPEAKDRQIAGSTAEEITFFTIKDGLSDNYVSTLYEDADRVLWVGTKRGISRLPLGKEGLPGASPLQSGEARSLGRDKPSPSGKPKIFAFTSAHGLFDNVINQIVEDDFGQLWIGCSRGIFKVPKQALHDVAAGRAQSVQCVGYDESDGLFSSETNGGRNQPSAIKALDGRLWFATTRGVVVIDPKLRCPTEAAPPVYIEEVRANGEVVPIGGQSSVASYQSALRRATGDGKQSFNDLPDEPQSRARHSVRAAAWPSPDGAQTTDAPYLVQGTKGLALGNSPPDAPTLPWRFPPGGAQVLEIRYTAPVLTAPENIAFRYRMEGYDQDWREADDERAAHYTNLRPGHYRFQVIARNHHGVWNQAGASFAFYLAPHYYQTRWFYVLCALTIGASVCGVHQWRVRVLQKLQQVEQQHALEKERARLARDIHDDLGARLTQIAFHGSLASTFPNLPDEIVAHHRKATTSAREAIQALTEVVWAINPQKDTLDNLAAFICQYCEKYLATTSIRLRLDVPHQLPDLPVSSDQRHALFLVVKEALHNVVRHANATEVWVRLALSSGTLAVAVEDDGRGFDPAQTQGLGDGLENMKGRLDALGGTFQLTSQPAQGTKIRFEVQLSKQVAKQEP